MPSATADPIDIQPYPAPYVPGESLLLPGAYTYLPYYPYLTAPKTTDTRGVRASTNADPAQTGSGLPGSKLGQSSGQPNILTSASARYGISGGITPPVPPIPSVNAQAGPTPAQLEDPTGAPPTTPSPAEASAPEPVIPVIMEDPAPGYSGAPQNPQAPPG
ncbi:hypothetical protein ACXPWS_10655 [Mycobacterium sp. BMJ-28]